MTVVAGVARAVFRVDVVSFLDQCSQAQFSLSAGNSLQYLITFQGTLYAYAACNFCGAGNYGTWTWRAVAVMSTQPEILG
jgi:hypothetical protein